MSEHKKKYKSGAAKRKWREESSANTKKLNTFFMRVSRDAATDPMSGTTETKQLEESPINDGNPVTNKVVKILSHLVSMNFYLILPCYVKCVLVPS